MREKCNFQRSLFEQYADHEIGWELQGMSDWLDGHREVLERVERDLKTREVAETGRKGMSVESVLRCALLKQYRQLTYDELVFCLIDSTSCQTFARLTEGWTPKKTALQQAISVISEETWEAINQLLVESARSNRIERGEQIRIDSTVTEATIHEPSDSSLLWDGVRTLNRLLNAAEELGDGAIPIVYRNHRRAAKKRMQAIQYTRGAEKKVRLYRELIELTEKTLGYVEEVDRVLRGAPCGFSPAFAAWSAEVAHYRLLIERVIDQTRRRVLNGEKVPASEKLFSLFEEHPDILVKGRREIQYGHKLNLSTGRSGLILEVVIEEGNPADSDRFVPMLDRHIATYGKAPRQMAADGGYASLQNLQDAKERQVKDVVFHKKRGLKIEEMAKSPWVYRKLRNFRAGIEAGISCLKRAYGLARCTWKGLSHFKSYVWSSVVAHNMALLGRLAAT